jgi:hypothetical protein
MENSIVLSHISSAAMLAYLMDFLQRTDRIPWITRDTTKLNTAIRIVLALFGNAGVHWAWGGTWVSGRTLMISIPALAAILHWASASIGQYFMQHMGERIMDIGRTWKITPALIRQIAEQVAAIIAAKQAPVTPRP